MRLAMRPAWLLPLLLLGVARAEDSVYWLDKAQADAAAAKLTSIPEGRRTAVDWVKLGWVQYLYKNDADLAIESFRKAGELDPGNGDAWEGLHAASLARLRHDLGVEAVAKLAESEPDSARVEALFRVGRVQANLFNQWTIPNRISFAEKLLAKSKNPFTQHALRDWLADLYATQLRTDRAFEHWLAGGRLRRWDACGFFGAWGAACYDDPLPPESEFKPAAEYPVARDAARWAAVEFEPGDTAGSAATRSFTNRGTGFYVRAAFSCVEERAAWVRLDTTMSHRAWLNGVEIGANDLIRHQGGTESWHGATLSKGANVLLVKFVAPGMFYDYDLTIHHEDGRAMTDLSQEGADRDPEVKKNGKEARAATMERDARHVLGAKAKSVKGCTLREALLASQLFEVVQRLEDANRILSEAFDLAPGSAYMQFFRGTFLSDYALLPAARRTNMARTHHERAVALDARFAPSLMQLAREYSEKDTDKAAEFVQQVIAASPSCAEAWSLLAQIHGNRGWSAERYRALVKAAEAGAGNYVHAAEVARWHAGQMNYLAAFDVIAKIKKDQGFEAYWEEIDLLGQAGKDEEQLAALEAYRKRYPRNARCLLDIAGLRMRQAKKEEAEAFLKQARALDPRNPDITRRLLGFYIDNGMLDRARETMDVILAEPARLGAYDEATRRYLAYLSGDGDDWTKPWDVDTKELVKKAPPTDSFGDSVHTVVLFEQRLVRVVGRDFKWREEDTHRVVKILSKEGGENYGQLFLGGGDWARFRIRELRVFTPDGRVLEMDAVQEEGNYRMPELDKGAILEFRITRGAGPVGVEQPVFELERTPVLRHRNEPILWRRYVVTVPAGADLRLDATLVGEPRIEHGEKTVTYLWEFRDLAEFEPEFSTPPADEILPGIRFVSGRPSIQQMLESMRSGAMGLPVTSDVAAKAAALTKDCENESQKVRALYEFVVTNIKQGTNQMPAHTLADGEGQHDDLFWALLKASGIRFSLSYCRAPRPLYADYDPLTSNPPYQFALFLVKHDKSETWLWPSRWNAWGALPNQLYGGEAIVVDGRSTYFRALPDLSPEEKSGQAAVEVTLDETAVADVKGALILSHGTAGTVRGQLEQFLGQDRFRMIVQNIASQYFRGITVKTCGASDFHLDRPELRVTFEGTTKEFAQRKKDSDRITFRAVAPALNLSPQLVRESDRKFPLRAEWAQQITTRTTTTVNLPEYESVKVPDGTSLAAPFGSYHVTYRLDGRTLVVERRLVFVAMDISPEMYPRFAEFCKAVDDAEKRQVVVKVKGG